MRTAIIIISVFMIVGCNSEELPLLTDIDQTVNDVDTAIFIDVDREIDDESVDADVDPDPQRISSLLVATIKGYDVPQSGKVYEFDEASLDKISQSSNDLFFGSQTGSDTGLAVFNNTFSVFARNYGKSIYFLNDVSTDVMDLEAYTEMSQDYLNFQDMVYNSVNEEYVISGHSLDELVIFKDGVFKRQKITDDTGTFPARMRAIGQKIYVAFQYLDDQWRSEKGVLAVIDMINYSAEFIDLGVKNPVGKIEYNPNFDKDHIYTTCSGTWAKRDGAVVRISLSTHRVEKVIRESSEEGSLLDVDMLDISISDNGMFYIVVSDNNENWINKLYEFDTKEGKVVEIDEGVNAFAANPIDYSSMADSIYYFKDDKEKTFINAREVKSGTVKSVELDAGPASLKIWTRDK